MAGGSDIFMAENGLPTNKNVVGNAVFAEMLDNATVVHDLMMVAEEDPLSLSQARAYQRELQFAKTFSLLLSEDGINPKDFDEDLEIEYGCKLDDVFKVSTSHHGSIKFVIPSNLPEARAMLQAKYQAILKGPLVAREDANKMEVGQSPQKSAVPDSHISQALTGDQTRVSSVKRTYGRAAQSATNKSDEPSKKRGVGASTGQDHPSRNFSSLREIEEYFYASIKGSESYTELKSDFRFECCVCNEQFTDNITTVSHMHSHLSKLPDSKAARCGLCYRWILSEQELEQHMDEHKSSETSVCRICDSEPFHDLADLAAHMKATHVRREMPYACRLCGFRSSLYIDAVEHFSDVHAGSSYAQCAVCLQIYQLKPPASGGACKTSNFFDHIQRHQTDKDAQYDCPKCRLSYLGPGDVPRHDKLEHQPGTSIHCVPRFPPTSNASSFGPSSSKSEVDLSKVSINLPSTSSTNGPALCRECLKPMAKRGHFGRFTSCTFSPGECAFSSACTVAMANHIARHKRQQSARPATTAPLLSKPLYCQCGFSSAVGAVMASHLLACPSGCNSCSSVPPTNGTTISTVAESQQQPQPDASTG